MYRVMIVDDEEPVLDSFAFMLDKYVDDFELCSKVRSGYEAIQLMKEQSPDLVFMDIQMPGIDGIETIRLVKDLFPETVFILATAYERFDIAKKAIQLGVFSYMVKPITKSRFIEELGKAKEHIDRLHEEHSKRLDSWELLEKSKNERRKEFLSSLIWKNPEPEAWAEFASLFSFRSERAAVIIVGGADSAQGIPGGLYAKITEKLEYKYFVMSTMIGDKLMLLVPEEQPLGQLRARLQSILNDSPEALRFGDGGVRHFSELREACSAAWEPFSDSESSEEPAAAGTRISTIETAYKSLLSADREEAGIIFREFWLSRFQSDSFNVAKSKMAVLFTLLLRELDSHILLTAGFNIDPSEEIMPLESVEAWESWADRAWSVVSGMIESGRTHDFPKPLTAALDYIAENYDKPIQLSSVADECGVTGSYLSRLFSEHLDSRFIDYLNRYRINRALANMKKGMSIKEASYNAGYRDPNYFSRVFRKFMGIKPSEYEKRSF